VKKGKNTERKELMGKKVEEKVTRVSKCLV